jgi:hypothetical protein
MSGCECKPDAKRKRDSAQPEAKGAAIKNRCASRSSVRWLRDFDNRPGCAFSKERGYFLRAQPPRLGKAGNISPKYFVPANTLP